MKWGLVPRNVCDAVEPPRSDKHEVLTLTPEQAQTFLKTAEDDRLHVMYVLAIGTGMRQGELFGLKWDDVDLTMRTLSVRRTITRVADRITVGEPKSGKGRRMIALPEFVVQALSEHRKRQLASGQGGAEWIFCDRNGGPLRASNVRRRSFVPILTKAALPKIRFHDLRHTSATLLLTQGVHPKVVQERLGHSQISMTLDIYSHVLPGMQEVAAGKLDDLMSA